MKECGVGLEKINCLSKYIFKNCTVNMVASLLAVEQVSGWTSRRHTKDVKIGTFYCWNTNSGMNVLAHFITMNNENFLTKFTQSREV